MTTGNRKERLTDDQSIKGIRANWCRIVLSEEDGIVSPAWKGGRSSMGAEKSPEIMDAWHSARQERGGVLTTGDRETLFGSLEEERLANYTQD